MFGLRIGKLGASLRAGSGSAGVTPLFARPFSTSASLGADATFARLSNAWVTDHEGVLREIPSGGARFGGARFEGMRVGRMRVGRNLFTNTTTTLASAAATTAVSVGVGTYVFSMGAGSGTATFSGTATGSTGTLGANASSRTAKTLTITVAGTIIVTASVADLATIMLENTTGASDTDIPSEYISVGVESAPYHGAGIDGLQFFATENGNTVTANVVTEGTGSAITGGSLLMEPAATNTLLYNNDWTNVSAWYTATLTVLNNAIASENGFSNIVKLTGSGASATQKITNYSATLASDLVISVYFKYGNHQYVQMFVNAQVHYANFDLINGTVTASGGSGVGSIDTLANGWYRCNLYVVATSSTDAVLSLVDSGAASRNATSSTSGYVYASAIQRETGSVPTSYIATTTVAVSRTSDTLSYSGAWTADNETRAVENGADVDVDDWDGVVDSTLDSDADGILELESINVYTTGERPA